MLPIVSRISDTAVVILQISQEKSRQSQSDQFNEEEEERNAAQRFGISNE